MIVQNSGGNGFTPDPLLDVEKEYEARVVGIIHVGTHQKQKHDGTNFIEEYDDIQQAIIEYEIVEDGTQVERGPEDAKRLENRRMSQFIKYSSHEKSSLFKLAQSINPKAAYIEKKQGVVDTSLIIGRPVSLELKLNKDGDKANIKAVNKIPPKYQESVNPLTSPIFQYSVMSGPHPVDGKATKLEDVPKWMLEFALNKALDADQFTELDAMEAHLEALNAESSEDKELDGDRLPPKDGVEDKKEDPEPKVKDGGESEAKTEEEGSSTRRTRRTRKKSEEPKEDYSTKAIDQLEVLVVEKGLLTDEDLDSLSESVSSDEDYKKALIAKLVA